MRVFGLMRLFILGLIVVILPNVALAWSETCATDTSARRTIVAFFDPSREAEPRDTRIHRYLELPLNYMGYRLIYVDPSDTSEMAALSADIAATVTWFDAPLPAPEDFANAMAQLSDICLIAPRALIFDHPGMAASMSEQKDWGLYLDRVGAKPRTFPSQTRLIDKTEIIDSDLIGYDTDFLVQPMQMVYLDLSDMGDTHLRIGSDYGISDLVITGPAGAYLHQSAAIDSDPRGGDFWITDPFLLLETVLGNALRPIPDITTRNGRRVFFSTVGASGWLAMMPQLTFGETPQSVPEVLRSRIFGPHTDLPVTLSVLMGDFDPGLGGTAATSARLAAEQLLAQPNVQPATSGETYIQDWDFFRNYEPGLETARLTQANSAVGQNNSVLSQAFQRFGGTFAQTDASAFTHTPTAPRKYPTRPYDLATETAGALAQVAGMARPDAQTGVLVWSGNARPFEAALDSVRAAGAHAIGGGGGICTTDAPSIANLWPHSVPVGNALQIYNALGGEAVYSDRGSPHRFQALADTLACTEEPRRLKPFQLAYSVESALTFETRQSILAFLDDARLGPFMPLTAADYIASATAFGDVEFEATGQTEWTLSSIGDIQTIRFDKASNLGLDMAQSLNTLGARRHGASLYVALDPGAATARISLKPTDAASGVILSGRIPALAESSVVIDTVSQSACAITVSASGFADGLTIWQAAPDTSYSVTVTEKGAPDARIFWDQIMTTVTGEIRVDAAVAPGRAVDITLSTGC